MRILLSPLLRRRNACESQHFDRPLPGISARSIRVHPCDFGNLVADSEYRVERGHRLLENHRAAIASNVAHARIIERDQVFSLELDTAAGFDSSRLLNQAQNRKRSY